MKFIFLNLFFGMFRKLCILYFVTILCLEVIFVSLGLHALLVVYYLLYGSIFYDFVLMSFIGQNKKYYKLVHESNKSIVYTSFVGFENYESIMAKKYEIIVCGYLLEILEVDGSL